MPSKMPKRTKPLTTPDGEVPRLDDGFFARAKRGRPALPAEQRKTRINMYVDSDIVAHFKADGRGWTTRINQVLRQAIERDTKAKSPAKKRA